MKIIRPIGLETAMAGPFKKGYKASQRQAAVRAVRDSSPLEYVVSMYEQFLSEDLFNRAWRALDLRSLKNFRTVLSPDDLNLFLQILNCYEKDPRYQVNTGFFITTLIDNSYLADQQVISLDFNGVKPFENLGSNSERHYQTVQGDVGHNLLTIVTKGLIGSSAFAYRSFFDIAIEKAGDSLCRCSSSFKARAEKAGSNSFLGISDAEVIVYDADLPETLFGHTPDGMGDFVLSYNIKVRTPNPALIEPFKATISTITKGELYFIHSQGREERVV